MTATRVAEKILVKIERRVMKSVDSRFEAFGRLWEAKAEERSSALERRLQAFEDREEIRSRASTTHMANYI
jgi:hypothetical protein